MPARRGWVLALCGALCWAAPTAGAEELAGAQQPAGPQERTGPQDPPEARDITAGGDLPTLQLTWTRALPQQPRSTPRLMAGGLIGGAVGFFGGGLAGAAIACEGAQPEEDLCALGGFIVGAAIAESALLPFGVHVANGGFP